MGSLLSKSPLLPRPSEDINKETPLNVSKAQSHISQALPTASISTQKLIKESDSPNSSRQPSISVTGSVSPTENEETQVNKKRNGSKFKQQDLPARNPIYSAQAVLPIFAVMSFIFIPTGITLLHFTNLVNEITIPYTRCVSKTNHEITCDKILKDDHINGICSCEVKFHLPNDFEANVLMYYELGNFYQNYRRYQASRDIKQLMGDINSTSKECGPKDDQIKRKDGTIHKIYPCGAFANSMFNDEITLFYHPTNNSAKIAVVLNRTGIAWPSDRKMFKNPKEFGEMWKDDKFVKPINWRKEVYQLDPDNPDNNGVQNEEFIVWMRAAALSTFRKLYRIVATDASGFRNRLPKGNYSLDINYSFEVRSFHGSKAIVLATESGLGSRNNFLGIAFIVVGAICFLLGLLVLFIHCKYGRSSKIDSESGSNQVQEDFPSTRMSYTTVVELPDALDKPVGANKSEQSNDANRTLSRN